MQKKYEIVYSKEFIQKFKKVLLNYYRYETYMDFIIIPFLWKKTLMYIPLLSYSDRKNDEVDDLLELAKETDYQIRTLNFEYSNFKKDDMVTMRINTEDIDELFNSFSSKTRYHINKIKKQNFTHKKGNSDEFIEHFYKLYSETMLRLGTPALEKNFFYSLRDEFQDKINFHNFYDGYKVIAGSCNLIDKEIGIFEWLGMDDEYKKKDLGYLIFSVLIETNAKKGLKILDFGRSGYGGGTYHFKKHFKMYPVKIDIYKPVEEDIYEKYKLASKIWQKLPKKFVDNFGCKLSKYLKDL